MKLNDLFACWKLGPVGKRDRMLEPAQLDAKNAIGVQAVFDDPEVPAQPRVQPENKPRQPTGLR
jgi:hypothetical protein